jgi:hypothetical protein
MLADQSMTAMERDALRPLLAELGLIVDGRSSTPCEPLAERVYGMRDATPRMCMPYHACGDVRIPATVTRSCRSTQVPAHTAPLLPREPLVIKRSVPPILVHFE